MDVRTKGKVVRPYLADLCACAGLGADGYVQAGFRVHCVDIDQRALRHNPHETEIGDVLALLRDRDWVAQFDALHISPPCQLFSATRKLAEAQGKGKGRAVDLLTPVLEALEDVEIPWVVENVERSPLKAKPGVVRLCGSSFGLKVQRHRLFYSNVDLGMSPACDHTTFDRDPITGKPRPWGVYYAMGDNIPSGGRTATSWEQACELLGVGSDRLPFYETDQKSAAWKHLCEGLPPAYTRWVGERLMRHV